MSANVTQPKSAVAKDLETVMQYIQEIGQNYPLPQEFYDVPEQQELIKLDLLRKILTDFLKVNTSQQHLASLNYQFHMYPSEAHATLKGQLTNFQTRATYIRIFSELIQKQKDTRLAELNNKTFSELTFDEIIEKAESTFPGFTTFIEKLVKQS